MASRSLPRVVRSCGGRPQIPGASVQEANPEYAGDSWTERAVNRASRNRGVRMLRAGDDWRFRRHRSRAGAAAVRAHEQAELGAREEAGVDELAQQTLAV